MTNFTVDTVRRIIDEAEAHRDGDGEKVGRFTDTNAYDFLRCARFLLGYIDQETKAYVYRTEAERQWEGRDGKS